MKIIYEIVICNQGKVESYSFNSEKQRRKWLFDYFTIGEEKNWAWEKYEQAIPLSVNVSFEKYVKLMIKHKFTLKIFRIRPHKHIILRTKEVEKN